MNAEAINPVSLLTFNGINGATGEYLLPQVPPRQIVAFATRTVQDKEHLYDLKIRQRQASQKFRGFKEGVDPKDLRTTGWGVIFADRDRERTPGVMEALRELLDLRRSQAGERYKDFTGGNAYRTGETKSVFLARHGAGPGPADPDRVPYYLLIVADPEAIPYTFQYQLDVQYAVGRLYFDSLDDYAQYAHSVVAMETGETALPRRAVFFGVMNQDDLATRLSSTQLVQPLANKMTISQKSSQWEIRSITEEGATKAGLADILGGPQTPALIFTASHGMGFPLDDPRQLLHQGALLCQNWPGPLSWREPIPEEFYFSADDVASDASLLGSLGFHFACYGAGTPQMDDFAHQAFREPAAIAPQAFIARLPQRLLSHPRGGMLAVVGHVERAWGYSFVWDKAESQLAVFESTLQRLMEAYPVGYAMEFFNERYAELSTELSSELQGVQFGKEVDTVALAGMWTANNDARSYVILGDPAVRLKVQPGTPPGAPAEVAGANLSAVTLDSPPALQTPGVGVPLLYAELAEWWPIFSKPEDYAEEAAFYRRLIISAAQRPIEEVLELGCGGGNNASHLKKSFRMTLVDLSEDMLAVSRNLNPDCEHFQGDMRSIRLGREFDAVFVHDAIDYMLTLEDLRRAIQTAYAHCRPGGVALFAPDHTRESFRPSTDHGGQDGEQRAIRYLEWVWDPDPADTTYLTDFAYLLRDRSGNARVIHDRHVCGLFSRQDWLGAIESAGFRAAAVPFDHSEIEPGTIEVFLGKK